MSYQYYPTGVHTAARMWAKFKRNVTHLCDPSAGKGHLVRYAKNGFEGLKEDQIPWLDGVEEETIDHGRHHRYRLRDIKRNKFADTKEVSVIEIDPEHHPSLKDLGAKVVGYDFLQVRSLATVSTVIMNPPYSEGAKHVLHAWDVVYDAEIVAIINAESIRNPYTVERKRLVELIEEHGSVEFLQDQFIDDVERSTNVEIALLFLEKVPGKYLDVDALLGGLRKGDNHLSDIETEVCTALSLPGNFIHDTCHRFDQAVNAARISSEASAVANNLCATLGKTLEEMQSIGVGNDFRETSGSIREAANTDFKKQYDNLKKRAWAQIIRSSLLTDRLSNQARKKLEASSSDIYELEFTESNIHGFLAGVIESMGDIYKDMICDLFDTVIERSSDNVVFYRSWKSNQKHRIGVRIRKSRFIIPRLRVSIYGRSLEYESLQFLADIDKCFGYLHGVKGPYDGLVHGFQTNEVLSGDRIETRYFDFRYYKGVETVHLYPRSESVVEKINLFVGRLRNWIPGSMEEANADFNRQYEKGEAFTKQYMEEYKKRGRSSYGLDNPAVRLIRAVKGTEDPSHELERLEKAIALVHDQEGIECGPSLEAPTATNQRVLPDSERCGDVVAHNEQLLLLSA
jgi:hypothetical protein